MNLLMDTMPFSKPHRSISEAEEIWEVVPSRTASSKLCGAPPKILNCGTKTGSDSENYELERSVSSEIRSWRVFFVVKLHYLLLCLFIATQIWK